MFGKPYVSGSKKRSCAQYLATYQQPSSPYQNFATSNTCSDLKQRFKGDVQSHEEKVYALAHAINLSFCQCQTLLEQACWSFNLALALARSQTCDYQQQVQYDEQIPKCAICVQSYSNDNLPIAIPACQHLFHKGCLIQWNNTAFSTARNDAFCPVCGSQFDENRLFAKPELLKQVLLSKTQNKY